MRISIICILLFTLFRVGMGNEMQEPLRHIDLSTQKEPAVFGSDVRLMVRYRNNENETWVVPEPNKSTTVGLRYRPAETDQHPGGYEFRRVQLTTVTGPDGQEMTARVSPKSDPIAIRPGQSHQFTVPFERDWTGNVRPGRWSVWIEDNNVGLKSNRLEITLIFTNDSIGACLEIARDKDASVNKRKWHAEYLQKVMPDLHLRWWRMPPNEPEPHEQEQMEQAIQRELDRFKTFWKDKANAPAIKTTIDQINREAGLEVNNANSDKSNPDE